MVWSIDLDDFQGTCSKTNQTFPLTRLIGDSLHGKNREKCKSLQRIVDVDVQNYLDTVTKMPYPVYEAQHSENIDYMITKPYKTRPIYNRKTRPTYSRNTSQPTRHSTRTQYQRQKQRKTKPTKKVWWPTYTKKTKHITTIQLK